MYSIDPSTYLVTGAAGFIGSCFVRSCNERGIPVLSVDDKDRFQDQGEHAGIDFGTVIDREDLLAWIEAKRPAFQAIIHLGACSDTMETNESYLRKTNIEYSQRLWNFAARERTPFIYASSAATYGGGEQGYDDDESRISGLKPLNLYGQSKQIFDLWALEEEKKGNRPPTWSGFKFFNVYGFGERHKGRMASVVLHSFDQIRAGGKIRLFKSHRAGIADGHQKRDFIFVDDVVDVLHFSLERPIPRGILNLGSGNARTFLDLARAVFRSLGKTENIEFIDTPEQLRDKYQYFTEARMERLRSLGYDRPFTSLEEGVERYVRKLSS